MMAGLAAHPQKAMFQTAAFEVVLELVDYIFGTLHAHADVCNGDQSSMLRERRTGCRRR